MTDTNNKTNSNPTDNNNTKVNTEDPSVKDSASGKPVLVKRILAIVGIVLLLLLYLATLLVAIFDRSESGNLFMLSIIASILVPIIIWIYSIIWKALFKNRKDS